MTSEFHPLVIIQPNKFNLVPTWLTILGWTALITLSMSVNFHNHYNDAFKHARLVGQAYIDKDLAVRRWITGHGGVYVKPTYITPPNPWLNVPKRDVLTTDGQALTLINPAYATRQLHEEFAAHNGIHGHLTALKLKNPNNKPDDWEHKALLQLEGGRKEVAEVVTQNGSEILRLMLPVYMEKGCLQCHADMDIQVGGLRGGITASVPMEPFVAPERAGMSKMMATHGVIWLAGLLGIVFSARRSRERHHERSQAMIATQKEDLRIAEILSMSERLERMSEKDIIQQGLEVGVRLTESRIGYFHFVNEDQNSIELVAWSKATLETYCHAAYDNHYPIEQAGIWADCARLRQPVMHNDYPNLTFKRGLPEGHAPLLRHLSVPVIESSQVQIITGVGNKEAPYDERDMRHLQLLANDIWKLIQRKRADSELRAREKSLREAQRLAHMGSWTMDHATQSIAWSDEMYSIFDVTPANFALSFENFLAKIHPDERENAEIAFRKAITSHKEYNQTLRILLGDGRCKFVTLHGITEYLPDGTPLQSVGTAQDVTEQKEMELLRRSEADLSALFEYTDRMVWSIDTQRRLIVGNTHFLDVLKQLTGRHIQPGEIMPPREASGKMLSFWNEHYQRALSGEKFSREVELSGLPDSPRWIDFSFSPILDEATGAIKGVTISGRDFTEHKRMEETQKRTLEQMGRMVRELESHHRRSMSINRLNDLLQSCRDEPEALEVISFAANEIFLHHAGCLSLVVPGGTELARVVCWGTSPCSMLSFAIDDCWALRRGQAHEVRQKGELSCTHFDTAPDHGYICLPLVVRGETLGLLNLEYPGDPTQEEIDDLREQLRTLGETIKLSLSNLRLRIALQEQATHDALTGLFNRRYLDETLPREMHRVERSGGSLAVAMIDIDHFKDFNDRMGHEAGDLVLHEIGKMINENLRKSDIGCRYGGEELVLILPDSQAEDAQGRLESICKQIREMSIPFRGEMLPKITVSVGIAASGPLTGSPLALLRAADEALYRAKGAGRDRIVVNRAKEAP